MAEGPTRLTAVPDTPALEPPPPPARGPRRALLPLLAVALLAVAFGAVQLQRNRALAGQIEALNQKLSSASAELAAYEERLGDVRTRVVDLRVRLDEVEALLEAPPEAPAP